jgi:hypothetical protein
MPIGNQQNQIGSHMSQEIRQTQRGIANGFGHSDIAIRAKQAFDSSGDFEAVFFDFLNRVAEFRGQV